MIDAEWRDAIAAAAGEVRTGAMVALVPSPDDVARLGVDTDELSGAETSDELHLTLVYLGEAATYPSELRGQLVDAVRTAVAGLPACVANAFGAALWNPGGDAPAWVLNVGDAPDADAPPLRVYLETVVDDVVGELAADLVPAQHTPWSPHVCLAYTADPAMLEVALSRLGPVTFDRVRLAFAGDVTDVPLDRVETPEGPSRVAAAATTSVDESRRRSRILDAFRFDDA